MRIARFHFLTVLAVLAASIMCPVTLASAQDWSSCASDLDDLRRRSDDAKSAAEEAEEAFEKAKSAQDELKQCLSYPKVYDLYRDQCLSRRNDFRRAKDEYESRAMRVQSAFDDVASKYRYSAASCAYAAPVVPPGVKNKDACAILLRRGLPKEVNMNLCSKVLPADECALCLGAK